MKYLRISVLLMMLLVACGGTEAAGEGLATLEESPTETSPSTTVAAADAEEAALEFAECMRENGLPDFQDPQFSEGGGINEAGPGTGFEPDSDEFQNAMEACSDLLEGVAFGPAGQDFDPTEIQDTLLAVAQCMRDQGYDVEDPTFENFGGPGEEEGGDAEGGGGPGIQIFGGLDIDDPEVQEALQTCMGESGFEGGPGGGFGGGGGE